MAKQAKKQKKQRVHTGFLTMVLLLLLLAGIGWQLIKLQDQVAAAQAERDRLAAQVEAKQQENAALSADIAEGATDEQIEEIARNELGLVRPGDYLFPDGGN